MISSAPAPTRRIELILRQIDSLPTLPAVATRLLSLTSSDDSHAREVVELVSADPALTAKVLALCRKAERGVQESVLTIERAVMLLGFQAIRNAVLSVKVFETFEQIAHAEPDAAGPDRAKSTAPPAAAAEPISADQAQSDSDSRFDRVAFWSHSLAVAILAEQIAAAHPQDKQLQPDEAFVCGLLHDVGKLALDHVLPKTFARVLELAELNHGNIAEYERRVVGIDHHTAGKRLAEQWQLPHKLQDCIWLHGTAYESLPNLPHARLVALVGLADMIARQQHVGYSGNFTYTRDLGELARKLGLDPQSIHTATSRLHDELEQRGQALGLHDQPSRELFLQSIQRANQTLGRLNETLEKRSRASASQGRVLEAISQFHEHHHPGQSVQDVLDAVADSSRRLLGDGFYAVLYPADPHSGDRQSWFITQYDAQGGPMKAQHIEMPPYAPDLSQMGGESSVGMNLMGVLPWIADYLAEAPDLRRVRLLPLTCGWGTAAVLLHDQNNLPAAALLKPLCATFGAAIASAAQHDGARRLGEELAESNRNLAQAQDRLLRQEALARIGEVAAGAAHEMNNPLAIISGRSQLLNISLQPGSKEHQAAQTIFKETHRLSDLITSLHMLADPPAPKKKLASLSSLLDSAIKKTQAQLKKRDQVNIALRIKDRIPPFAMDAEQIRGALVELLANAVQAQPRTGVQIVGQVEPGGQAVVIRITDDGEGMDEHTLSHAMDPFFSAKPAGRRVGMGLPRAQQWIHGHNGTLELHSQPAKGTTVVMTLPIERQAPGVKGDNKSAERQSA